MVNHAEATGEKRAPRPRYRCDIAVPFSDDVEKLTPKLYSLVRKCHTAMQAEWAKKGKKRGILKGIREITKVLRQKKASEKLGETILVLGADSSPYDVVSHLPVLAEEAGVTYVWVPSRKELGASAGCRRPTSVVLLKPTEEIASSVAKCQRAIARMGEETAAE
eukprot:PhM_4_TR14579/c0_g1_i1/m.102729/K11129/NHP2, NOLA2; H/ACA ribonucleoprotein complex subunit 2